MLIQNADTAKHKVINARRALSLPYAEKVPLYRKYARGEQTLTLTDEQKELLAGLLNNEDIADNICHQIIAEAADRLVFERWECENAAVDEFLSNLFVTANMDDRQGEVHYDGLRDSHTILAVHWDNDRQDVVFFDEPAWDGESGTYIEFDRKRNALYAVKDWYELAEDGSGNRVYRRIIWYPDRFERWRSTSGTEQGWEPHVLDGSLDEGGDGGRWPVPWVKKDGSPLHIPYVMFPNSARGSGIYGVSELSGGIIAFQDAINDLRYAMAVASRMTAYQQYYATGVDYKDAEGKPTKPQNGPGVFHHTPNPAARYGAISAGDMSQLLSIYDNNITAASRVSRTPRHTISGGDWPSGEALLRAEQPAVGKATRQIAKLRSCYATLAHRAVEIRNRYSTEAPLPEDVERAMITARFASAERRDPLSKSVIVNNLGERISDREALLIMGYDENRATEIIEEKMEEAKTKMASFGLAIERGTAPGTELPGKGPGSEEDADETEE